MCQGGYSSTCGAGQLFLYAKPRSSCDRHRKRRPCGDPIVLARRSVHNRFGTSCPAMRPLRGTPAFSRVPWAFLTVHNSVALSRHSRRRVVCGGGSRLTMHVCICHRGPASSRVCKAYAYYADPVQPTRHLLYLIVSGIDQMHELFGCRGPFMANVSFGCELLHVAPGRNLIL
jgi:hypothetical protein